ncbi:hypothetical protein DVH24_041549 [Malus domestica]|uniref:Uncharacterized protein n=1 Tax=Malus domestica TaxID=3750 RepID=A0A498IE54_MALDO|nr:hypothetical protein DVH24_041549 [Malus domestica]
MRRGVRKKERKELSALIKHEAVVSPSHSFSLSLSLVAANTQTDRLPPSAGDRNRRQIQSLKKRGECFVEGIEEQGEGSDIEESCKESDVEKTRAATAVNNILSGVNGHISLWEEIQLIRADDKNILYILSLYCAQHTEQGALYRILL